MPALAARVLAATLLSACAVPQHGWRRGPEVCADASAPRICFVADPDQPLELRVADIAIVPGECAEAPPMEHCGLDRVEVIDGRGGSRTERIRLRPGHVTWVRATADELEDEVEDCTRSR